MLSFLKKRSSMSNIIVVTLLLSASFVAGKGPISSTPDDAPAVNNMASCSMQANCLKFTSKLITSNLKCGGTTSEYQICAIVDLSQPSCTKEGTISHSCMKDSNTCVTTTNSFSGTNEVQNVASGNVQCQIVRPGTSVQFLFKDGKGCTGSSAVWKSDSINAACAPRPSSLPSCTGNGAGIECIWTIDVPPASAPVAAVVPAPNGSPVAAPIASPGNSPTPLTFGDPHFATYDGTQYTYHGECDLIIAHNPSFGSGLGLDIHARTEIVTTWSLIANAAVRIGDDTFEVVNDGTHYFNGVANVDLPVRLAGRYEITKADDGSRITYTIEMSNGGDNIYVTNFKRMIGVRASRSIGSVGGMSGIVNATGLLGRDAETRLNGPDEMAAEWQVRDTEAMLFHQIRAPQFPQQCRLPLAASTTSSTRRLRSNNQAWTIAEEACEDVVSIMKEFCIEDVLQTNDISVAMGYLDGVAF